ncbi:fungal zn binuclear cluster domain-containing protein [Fusarium bulbicola]|nr:fungal zn binuclear cluster domain-containing protein [Fusarium bulbicola]
MKKLSYRKSRKGCLRCNATVLARRNVGKHTLALYIYLDSNQALQQASSTSSPPKPGKDHTSPSPTTGLFSYFARLQLGSPGHSDNQSWILDMELMHHYTAEGHQALYIPCHHDRKVLQSDIPREGLTQPFLLHQILAFSALHLAYLNPEYRHKYVIQASQHQGIAIYTMNSMLAKSWDPDACHAVYGTSISIAISAFGMFPSSDRYNTFRPIDSLLDIFILARGMRTILRSSEENIRKGPLGRIMTGCSCEPATLSGCLAILTPQLKDLSKYLQKPALDICENNRKTITETMATLIESIEIATSNKKVASIPEQRVIFGWPMRLSSTFLTLLRKKDPLAIALLSYYCVLLQFSETEYWYFEGWSTVLIKDINAIVTGTPWEKLIQWPIDITKSIAAKGLEKPGSVLGRAIDIPFNIGFDEGKKTNVSREKQSGNANAVDMSAQYWASKIRAGVELDPSMSVGHTVSPASQGLGDAVLEFFVDKNIEIPISKKIVTVVPHQLIKFGSPCGYTLA